MIGIYVGIKRQPVKFQNGYVGITSKARKIKKGYIGIDGIARLCFEENKNRMKGDGFISLTYSRDCPGVASTSKYVIYFGGANGSYRPQNAEAIDKNLTITVIPESGYSGTEQAGAAIQDRAFFAGGYYNSSQRVQYYNNVYTVDENLTVRYPSLYMDAAVSSMGAVSTGSNAIFSGGRGANGLTNNVYSFDYEYVKTLLSPITIPSRYQGGTTVGNYILFGGGDEQRPGSSYFTRSSNVYVYDNNFTKQNDMTLTRESSQRCDRNSANNSNYAIYPLVPLGSGDDAPDAFDKDLVKRRIPAPVHPWVIASATTLIDNVVFYGQGEPVDPEQPLGHWTRASEAYSKHLVHQVVLIEQPTSLSNYLPQKGGTIGDCAIFAQSQKDEIPIIRAY